MYVIALFLFFENVSINAASALPLAYVLMAVGAIFTAVAFYSANKLRQKRLLNLH